MFQIQLINAVVAWERRLEIEEEKQENLKGEPYKDITVVPQPCQKERQSIFVQLFKPGRASQPVYCCCTYHQCRGKQPG